MHASPVALPAEQAARSALALIPWQLWCVALGVSVRIIGVHWDISWHGSIGRDTFWSPPHVAVYACGVLAAVCSLSLVWTHTFGRSRADHTVSQVLRLRAPLGAFVIGWGGIAMLTAAPFDDWWHGAYGLDVKVMSPSHTFLFFGAAMIDLGALLLMLAARNGLDGPGRRALDGLLVYSFGLLLAGISVVFMTYFFRIYMHSGLFYRTVALVVPGVLAMAATASENRFARTWTAAVYTAIGLGLLWILPLFPATPMLGPVNTPVDRFIPGEFPLLLIAPALLMDLLAPRLRHLSEWRQALITGCLFAGVMLLVQWPFSTFMQSEHARNWVFGAHYFAFPTHPDSYEARYLFAPIEKTATRTLLNLALSFPLAALTTRLGMAVGGWCVRVRR